MQQLLRWLARLALTLSVVGCGGGGDGAAPAAVGSRVEAGPAAVLLTEVGASRTLSAQLLDAAGAPLPGALSWSSSDPAVVAVDAGGTVRALAAAGSARVTASSGALQSSAILVTIAQPVAGAQLLPDSQIVSGPTAVDAAAEPAAGNPYEVVLRGAPALAVGSLVIASESANVAGRVLSVQPEGADQRVRLVAVPPSQLFTSFDFRDSVDLTQGPFEIPADLAAVYDVVQTGSTFTFTPKPGAIITRSGREQKMATGTAAGTFALPPFRDCESSIGFASGQPTPIGLSAPPSFEVSIDGTARREANAQNTRFIVTGSPKFKFNSVLEIKAAFEAKLGCKLTLVTRKFRVPGWAGLFFGGDVEFGIGFEAGGKFTLVNAKVGGSAALNTTLEATLDCPAAPASCTLGGTASAQTELKPELQAPNLNQAQFEPSVSLFGFVTLEAGNADVQQLQFKAIEIKAGAELAASLAPEALQIDNLDATTGRSRYALAFKGEVGPGLKLGSFLQYIGLGEVVPLKLAFEAPLGTSPTAASVSADRARYLPGEAAVVTVKLDAASTLFPSGLAYNVERVVLRRKTGLVSTEFLADQVASAGQTEFTLGFTSPGLLDAGEIFAFVVTKALPLNPPALELAAAQGAPGPAQPAQFVGRLTLEAVTSDARLTFRTLYDLSVTAEVNDDGIIVLAAVSGTGSETYTYASDALFNCGVSGELAGNRPPESEGGTVTGGSGLGITDGSATDQAVITPRVEGTRVSNSCSGGVWTNTSRASSGSLGSFKGTAVVAGGVTVALDFNANFTDEFGKRTVTTGRLERSP